MQTVGQPPRCCTSSFKGRNIELCPLRGYRARAVNRSSAQARLRPNVAAPDPPRLLAGGEIDPYLGGDLDGLGMSGKYASRPSRRPAGSSSMRATMLWFTLTRYPVRSTNVASYRRLPPADPLHPPSGRAGRAPPAPDRSGRSPPDARSGCHPPCPSWASRLRLAASLA